MPTFVFTSPDGKEHEVTGPEGATEEEAFGILQSQIGQQAVPEPAQAEPSFLEDAGSYAKNLAIGVVQQAVGVVPSLTQGINRTMGGVLQAGAQGLEGLGVTAPGGAQRFTEQYNQTMLSNPYAAGKYNVPVAEFAGEVVPMLAAAPETALGMAGVGGLSAGLRYNEQGPTDPGQRAIETASGAALGAAAKPVTNLLTTGGRVGIGAAKSIYNRLRGAEDPYAPLHEALTPITQRITGIKPIIDPATPREAADLAKNIDTYKDWINEADAIGKITGKQPKALLSSQFGSGRISSAEQGVLKSSAADKAQNELSRIQDEAVQGVKFIGGQMRKQPVSPERAGAAIYKAHVDFETKLTKDLEDGAAANYGKIRDTFGDLPMMNYNNTKKTLLEESLNQADSGNFAAARSLKRMADNLGSEYKDIEAVMNYRKLRARNARGVGSIAGLGREDTAAISSNIVKSINDDILEAGARFGNPDMQAALKQADVAYREGYASLRKARESTLGKMVDVKAPAKGVESINKRARLTAEAKQPFEKIAEKLSNMEVSEFRTTMRNLSSVDPTIEKRVGRYMIDKAVKEAAIGGARTTTGATHNITKLFDSINDSHALNLIRNKTQRTEAETIMKWIARAADRTGGGGAATEPIKEATSAAMAAGSMSLPFVIKVSLTAGLAPVLERALFTEAGRRSMKIIMKYPKVNPVIYEKAMESLFREQDKQSTQATQPDQGVPEQAAPEAMAQ